VISEYLPDGRGINVCCLEQDMAGLAPWIVNPYVVQVLDTTAWGSPSADPSGQIWIPGATSGTGTFSMVDSESEEDPFYSTQNHYRFTPAGLALPATSFQSFSREATGVTFDPASRSLYISDDNRYMIYRTAESNPGTVLNSFSTRSFATDPEDVAFDVTTGNLFIVDGGQGTLSPRSIFEVSPTGQLLATLRLPSAITDPEALAFDPVRQVFYVSGSFSSRIYVVSRDGQTILDTIAVLNLLKNPISGSNVLPKGLALAPTSDPNDGVNDMSLWVADYGADQVMDGRVWEIKLNSPTAQPPAPSPVARNDSFETNEDTSAALSVLSNDSSSYRLGISSVTQGANGTVKIDAGKQTITYTPNANFSGIDTFKYTVTALDGKTATATVTVAVKPINDPPTAMADNAATVQSTPVVVQVLANDVDRDAGDVLSVLSASNGQHGTVVVNDNNTITYAPNSGYVGTDTFSYTIRDLYGSTAAATVTVKVGPANQAPAAAADSAVVAEDSLGIIRVLDNDSDPDPGDTLSIRSTTQGANGTVSINPDKTVTYTPRLNFFGTDQFQYTIIDSNGASSTASVQVNITPVNDAPVAAGDTASTSVDASVQIRVLDNDADVDPGDTLSLSGHSQGVHGTVSVGANNALVYMPDSGFSGTDTFSYMIRDNAGLTSSATVSVTVSPGNRPPEAVADNAAAMEDKAVTINILANDRDPDIGDTRTVISVTAAASGSSVVLNGDGTIRYTADADAFDLLATGMTATDSFFYTIRDAAGAQSTAKATVIVTGQADGTAYTLGPGNDTLNGTGGEDTIDGGAGDDRLYGKAGADRVFAGVGADKIDGGEGHDWIDGGVGSDSVTGGAGDDTFIFRPGDGQDRIVDFRPGTAYGDVVQFSGSVFTSFEEVMARAHQTAVNGVRVTLDADNTVTMQGVVLAQLTADDFRFV
jgi:VCBS repeat-containing protein